MNLTQLKASNALRQLGRVKRVLKKNVKKNRLIKRMVTFALLLPLVIPVGVVTAAYNTAEPVTAESSPAFETNVTLTLNHEVITVPEKTVTIEVASTSPYLEKRQAITAAAQKRVAQSAIRVAAVPYSNTELMKQAGIPENQWAYVDFIINREAGWNGTQKYNRRGSGAYGICQALPGGKMASAGSDWRTNSLTQLKWCNGYALSRYGSWQKAYQFWITHRYW